MEEFVLSVFKAADDADRAGGADMNLAHRFWVASQFIDVLGQFHGGELPPDLLEKRRYALYKASYIRDCLKKGMVPEAGPPGGDNDNETATPAESVPKGAPVAGYPAAS